MKTEKGIGEKRNQEKVNDIINKMYVFWGKEKRGWKIQKERGKE